MPIQAYFHTFLWASVPFLELRASIPLGYLYYKISLYEAIMVSVIGITCMSALLILILPKAVEIIEKYSPFFDKFMKNIFKKTRAKHSHQMALIGEITLITFIAVPIPGSGAWTGVLIAYLFNIPFGKTLWLVFLGVLSSALIIAVMTLFGENLWTHLIK